MDRHKYGDVLGWVGVDYGHWINDPHLCQDGSTVGVVLRRKACQGEESPGEGGGRQREGLQLDRVDVGGAVEAQLCRETLVGAANGGLELHEHRRLHRLAPRS